MQVRSHIKFSCVVRTFSISDVVIIYIDVRTACYSEERQYITPFRSVRSVGIEKGAVDPRKVILFARILPSRSDSVIRALKAEYPSGFVELRDLRRIIRELIPEIHIKRPVVAAELPARRHIYLIEFQHIGVKYVRKLRRSRKEPEIPFAIQANDFRRLVPFIPAGHFIS